MNYAAYLRVYQPVSAFHEPDRSRWVVYAASIMRPRRRDALAAEHAEALRRITSAPPVADWAAPVPPPAVPAQESKHAYVRSFDGVCYVCPWQTRLRSLLASGLIPAAGASGSRGAVIRPHIKESCWTVPLAWFVPFAGAERWIALGQGSRGQHGVDVRATAQVARTLVYVTPMSRARRRVARGLVALRGLQRLQRPHEPSVQALEAAEADLAAVGRWLEGFHPHSLVELDYGGLVHLLSDDALCADESVAEMGAAIDGMSRGHCELAMGMYCRAQARWRTFREFEQVN